MKISIITTCFNSEETIEDTLKSVFSQTHSDIEYIIVDGKSTDGTLKVVEKYKDKIKTIVSEKDNGIYDGINKGIKLATGDIIGILHSDDIYADNTVISTVIAEVEAKNVDCVWGDLVYVKRSNTDKILRYWKSSPYKIGKFKWGWHPPHPSFFVKREIYEKHGLYRQDLPIAADYELMLRFLERYNISFFYIHKVLVKMRFGGKSSKSIMNIVKANLECIKAFKMNNLKVNPILFFLKPFLKIFQY